MQRSQVNNLKISLGIMRIWMDGCQVQRDEGQMFSGEQFEENGFFLYNYGE